MSVLRWADVADAADGDGVLVTVRRSKTNQEGETRDVGFVKDGCRPRPPGRCGPPRAPAPKDQVAPALAADGGGWGSSLRPGRRRRAAGGVPPCDGSHSRASRRRSQLGAPGVDDAGGTDAAVIASLGSSSAVGDDRLRPTRRKPMVVTLLGQLAPGWCREAAAKRALAYILDPIASPYMALAFTDFLRQTGLPRFTLSRVESDPDQPDDPGPDVTICDAEGKPRVFVQMTFFGAVNDAQPATYLRQLPVDAPSALVFLAPGYRIPGLWRDLKTNCSNAGIRVRDESPGVRMVWARARGRILVLGCWMHVLNSIDWVASVVGLERSIPSFEAFWTGWRERRSTRSTKARLRMPHPPAG